MNERELEALRVEARRRGWVSGNASLAEIRRCARWLSWSEVATRASDQAVSELKPTSTTDAMKRSLSASYGFGQQPLHTDGAHLRNPPDLLLLASETPSLTPTSLWVSTFASGVNIPWNDMYNGVFMVNNGKDSFFTPARLDGRMRYDPGCMVPCDSRARSLKQFFDGLVSPAIHSWRGGDFLLIDNTKTLHARGAVPDNDLERTLTRVAYRVSHG